jgi:hypothetical protein
MAHLDTLETRADTHLAALYWWRRDGAPPSTPLQEQLISLAERAAPATPHLVDLPSDRPRANTEAKQTSAAATTPAAAETLDPDLLAAIRRERRHASFAVATGLIATAAPAAAAIYAAAAHESIALGFAMAGMCAASFALYHAMRWLLLLRSDELPRVLI